MKLAMSLLLLAAILFLPPAASATLLGVQVTGCGPNYDSCKADPTPPGYRPPPTGTFDPFDGTAMVRNDSVEFIFTSDGGVPLTADFSDTAQSGDKLRVTIFNPSFVINLTVPDPDPSMGINGRGWWFTFPDDLTILDVEVDFGRTLNLFEVDFGPHHLGVELARTVIAPRATAEVNFTIAAIPEPATAAMVAAGISVLGAAGHRRRTLGRTRET
jgi:hypothetical protein